MVPLDLGDDTDELLNRESVFAVDMSMDSSVNISVEDVDIFEANTNVVHGDSLGVQHPITTKVESMLNIESRSNRGLLGESNLTTNGDDSITNSEPDINLRMMKCTSEGTISPIVVPSKSTVEDVQVGNLFLCIKELCKKLSILALRKKFEARVSRSTKKLLGFMP